MKHEVSWLQNSCLNIARLNYLRNARAVLSTDIDEFIKPIRHSTVFDEAVKSIGGLVSFRGQWAYPEIEGTSCAQRDHVYESKTPRDSTLNGVVYRVVGLGEPNGRCTGTVGFMGNMSKQKRFHIGISEQQRHRGNWTD